MSIKDVMSVSGGKDSAAMWILAVKEMGKDVLPVFCDTGNEHPMTYEYVDYLETKLGPVMRIKADFSERIANKRQYILEHWEVDGVPVEFINKAAELMVPTGNPFLDLCIWKGRFPSTKARFCTQFLKIIPTMEQVYMPLLEEGNQVISWQGVRAAESAARAKLPEREDTPEGYSIYRPLLKWSARDVFDMHRKHRIEPNPLYKLGMGRVGCMPCINANKAELFEIQRRFPEEVKRIAEWENIVSQVAKRQRATFFPDREGSGMTDIHEWVEWSKTSYGGGQYDLLKMIEQEEFPQCSSVYGLCE
ncbi:phosphoadenosine phosphosulfate reductase domain-containing protein [Paenibacillus vini]|uniref:Phosphoadenosine phosphosulphate reductase domain-containing protein n=1 Tax=Paenibacillus vini TaxID=1476024 RepID=A0ABQ4MJ17_9BACL|nr:phosphoadenosine phosphosulfate reductase family protein [Paenibacillus vini]GIP55929.1 hypothetical protein J42TS3_49640 [Paenibacillus vini]